MVRVTKVEKEAILKSFPDAHIRRTMKHKSGRHHYFCEESDRIMAFLKATVTSVLCAPKGRCSI